MHRTCDHQTKDLFDPWAFLGEKRRKLLDQSWARVFREHLLERLPVGELARHFSQASGRPTKDLYVVMGMLILQQMQDLTDAAAVEALAFNVSWHFALDIRVESDAYVCEKTLRNYRRLVVENGLDRLLFENLTDELIKAFSVDTSKQRLDSTAIRSAMRSLTRLGVVVEAISKFVRELARVHPDLHARVDQELIRRYVERDGDGCFADTTPSVSKRRLPEAAQDLLNLTLIFERTEAAELASFKLLQRILNEQFEVLSPDNDHLDARVRIKEPSEIPCDNVRNPADPDSTYNAHRGQGYLTQVMETYQEDDDPQLPVEPKPDLITHVSVGKMTVHDGHCLDTALKKVSQRQARPDQVLADSHYGSNENIALASDRDVELISPAMTAKGSKRDQLTLENFELDAEGLITACPAGHAPISATTAKHKLQARFDPALCRACPRRDQCPTCAADNRGEGRRFQYTPQRVQQRQRRLNEESEEFQQRYRWRAGLEATMSRLKHQVRLAHLRIRGMSSVTYTVVLRALGLNIRRCVPFMVS